MKEFFKTLLKTLNPLKHHELSDRLFKDTCKFYCCLTLIGTILAFLISLTFFATFGNYLGNQFDNFDNPKISFNSSMSNAIAIPLSNPLFVIDTTNNPISQFRGIRITEDTLNFGYGLENKFGLTKQIAMDDLKYLNGSGWPSIINVLVLFLLPSVLVILFLYEFIKFGIILLIFSLFGWLISHSLKNHISFAKVMKISIYSSSLMILLHSITLFLPIETFYAEYVIGALYFAIAIIQSQESNIKGKNNTKRKNKKLNSKDNDGYVDWTKS